MLWLMPLRACVHVTHGTWLNGSFRAMCQVRVKDMYQVVRKVGGSFLTWINSADRQERKRKKEKQKRRKKIVHGKKKKRKRGKEKIFLVFR